MLKDVFGLIYAGEDNHNLRELVLVRSVAALPVGGRYRVIDFHLSNMVNSGVRNVGIITRKNYQSLMDHVGPGKEWDLSRKTDGLFILPPYDNEDNIGIYRGLSDAIKSNMNYIKRASQPYCLLSGSSSIFTTAYNSMFNRHVDTRADITLLYNVLKETRPNEKHAKTLKVTTDDEGWVTDADYDYKQSVSDKMSMEVVIMHKSLLEFIVDRSVSRGFYESIGDIVFKNFPNLRIQAIEHQGYVGRLDSIQAYYNVNQDMLSEEVQKDLFYTGNPVYTKVKDAAPVKYGEEAYTRNSLLANGCVINGSVEDSLLFRGVTVAEGAKVKNCIIMQDGEVEDGSDLEYVIVDKNCRVKKGRSLIGSPDSPVILRKGSVY